MRHSCHPVKCAAFAQDLAEILRCGFAARRMTIIWAVLLTLLSASANAAPGIALFGELKYKPGFAHFDYVNPDAPKAGEFRLSYTGGFDSLNPFIIKGVAAPGLTSYLFQSLMAPSYDEPQSYYGLIAEDITLAPDRSYADFRINVSARWHDGEPITPDDVVFSFETLKTKGHPAYRLLYKPISKVEKRSARVVRFYFDDKQHRELPLIAASMPVLPKHYFEKVPFEKTSLEPPVGSGPYHIKSLDAGRSITFERVKDYWAENLPTQKGLNNFDTIRIDVYRDDVVALEGFKSGQFDFYEEYIARNWATAYDIPAVKDGRIIKTKIEHKIPRGMQAFIFNTRRDKFSDRRVREAIGLTMDFEWMNQTLFYSAYEHTKSFFQNTEFAAAGLPKGKELELLKAHEQYLPPYITCNVVDVPKTDGSGYARDNLIRAQHLLDEAGWVMKDGVRVNAKTGEKLTVEFLMMQRTFERVIGIMRKNLKKLGIDSSFRYVDESQYQKRVEKRSFDVVSIWWNQGVFFPGTEQHSFWHSSQADTEASQNLGGVKNPLVDDLVTRIVRAKNINELRPAAQALDRVLSFEHYVIPHWYLSAWRVSYWNKFGRPEITPAYNIGLDSWWDKSVKSDAWGVKREEDSHHTPRTTHHVRSEAEDQ
jgi:microcin C transport system substrate-binding protein